MGMPSCACTFCEEFSTLNHKPNRKIWEDDNFVVIPSLGALTPGYLLLMPKHHIRSFADSSPEELTTALDIAERTREVVSQVFGPVILAEHGPGSPESRSSACCDHAHWHLIPCNPYKVSVEYERMGGRPAILNNISSLRSWSGNSYLFLSPLKHVYWVWEQSEQFTSQFVRQVCAQIMGIGDFYDWAIFPFKENMIMTKQRLTEPLRQSMQIETYIAK
jgi:diadenosine tetraphosphate (Ap4A) HIT family hydrolase